MVILSHKGYSTIDEWVVLSSEIKGCSGEGIGKTKGTGGVGSNLTKHDFPQRNIIQYTRGPRGYKPELLNTLAVHF